ncbi:MAG: hypothetical protein AAF799_20620 [Myxococcota bacterium]
MGHGIDAFMVRRDPRAKLTGFGWWLLLCLAACSGRTTASPEGTEASTGDSTATPTVVADSTTTGLDSTTTHAMSSSGSSTTTSTSGSSTATSDSGSGSGSSSTDEGPPPRCLGNDDCPNFRTCEDGVCVYICQPGTWEDGTYERCISDHGGFDTENICGPDHGCLTLGDPLQAGACARQCTDVCDCPFPEITGTAKPRCQDIDGDGGGDCILACDDGEVCPDGMACLDGTVCMTAVTSPVPMYGDCVHVDAPCEPGSQCIIENGYNMCVGSCSGGSSDCSDDIPGPDVGLTCQGVMHPPVGNECHVPCGDGDPPCPESMECYMTNNGWPICMWPPT